MSEFPPGLPLSAAHLWAKQRDEFNRLLARAKFGKTSPLAFSGEVAEMFVRHNAELGQALIAAKDRAP